jgi:hypothetical protein
MPTAQSPRASRPHHPFPAGVIARLLLLFLAGLLCACGARTKSPRDAADEFFKLVSAKKFADAYERASVPFRFTRSIQYFEARARELGLDGAPGVEWGDAKQQGRTTKIRGVFKRQDGTELALNVTLILQDGEWRLDEALSDPSTASGVMDDVFAVAARSRDSAKFRTMEFLEPVSLAIPGDRDLAQLVVDTLMKFNEAMLNGGDFSALYADASDRWKYRGRDPVELAYSGTDPVRSKDADPFNNENRLTTAALRTAFAAAVQAKVDLSPIKGAKMILSEPPRINSDGVLNVNGAFDCAVFQASEPDKPRRLNFMLEYVLEASKWKLFGLTVHIIGTDKTPGK